jgi:16S rRNA (adenine1518-N6/adenine1519-N6)-dimethyltransferase
MAKHVRAKKHLGQHFLKDESIAEKIANSIGEVPCKYVLEIGPGMGVMTKYLLEKDYETFVIEVDLESVAYLSNNYTQLKDHIIGGDFLKWDASEVFGEEEYALIGNFPYNISSQIVFKTLEQRDKIPVFAGMFQKEVAERICAKEGSKVYGILSVLCQAFYDVEYLFTVDETVFIPPPRVKSGVMRMVRKENFDLGCSPSRLKDIVKGAFNQRRKTLRNALKRFNLPDEVTEQWWASKRAEQLTWQEFVELTNWVEKNEL